jgi:hypothetical protein
VTAFSLCSTSIVKANDKPKVTCENALHACELYVETFEVERQAYKNVIAKQDQKLNELLSKPESIAWYWFVLGGVVGGIALSKTLK